jgi:alpha-glucosidase (family GH31 glycosyl hydrolase)
MMRESIRLRGALTPHIYTLARQTQVSAVPFMRPMWWDNADEAAAWSMPEQYTFGSLVVHPVVSESTNESTVATWLPLLSKGTSWMSWDGQQQWSSASASGTTVTATVAVKDTPIFVPEGTVLPMWPPGIRVGSAARRAVMWTAWVDLGRTAHAAPPATLYEDDGESLDHHFPNNAFATTSAALQSTPESVSLNISRVVGSGYVGLPQTRTHIVQVRSTATVIGQVSCTVGTVTTVLTLGDVGDYDTAGRWWRVLTAGDAEMSCPQFALVAVCPAAPVTSGVHVVISL